MDFFTIVCYLIIDFYTKLFVYNLDVFNLFNIYDTKSARDSVKIKLFLRSAKLSINEYLKLKKQGLKTYQATCLSHSKTSV